jgi:DNA invertase Pin-like site-specific DNA recombinase
MSTLAYAYYRISQDRTGEHLGVDRQQPDADALRERLGMEWIGDPYIDNDLSATTGKRRPAFEQLLTDLQRNPLPVIIWHTDRLIRGSDDLERVIKTGVNVHAAHVGHLDLSTPAGRAVARTVTAWAQYEGEQKALRQVAANQQKASRGKPTWSRRPFGYNMDGTLHPIEAQLVRDAFNDVLAGSSLRSVVRSWNDQGIRTTLDGEWDPTGLRWVLASPRNAGIATYRGEEVGPGDWAVLVPEETFRAVLRLLANPARRTQGQGRGGRAPLHLLGGIATCAECDGPMGVNRRKSTNGDGYSVLVCRDGGCASLPMLFADDVVTAAVIARLSDPRAATLWAPDGDGIGDARAEVTRLQQDLDEWAEDRASGLVTREQMLAATATLRPRLAFAEERYDRLANGTPLYGLAVTDAGEIATWWHSLDVERRRAVVRWVLERVAVRSRGKGRMKPRLEHLEIIARAKPR